MASSVFANVAIGLVVQVPIPILSSTDLALCLVQARAAARVAAVSRALTSGIQHAANQAVAKGLVSPAGRAGIIDALRNLTKSILKNGFPPGTLPDPRRLDSVLVPLRNGGAAVYEIAKNGTAHLRTVLNSAEFVHAKNILGL